jgi:hypothetical protein
MIQEWISDAGYNKKQGLLFLKTLKITHNKTVRKKILNF